MVSQAVLMGLLHFDPPTGTFSWKVSRSRTAKAGDVAGTINVDGYRKIGIRRQYYSAHRLAWLYVYGEWPRQDIDHVNRNPDDNRISNLRLTTSSQNQGNRGRNRNSTSGFRGVSFHKRSGKYQASVRLNYQCINLGYFDTAAEAGIAAETERSRLFGEFAAQYDLLTPTPARSKELCGNN